MSIQDPKKDDRKNPKKDSSHIEEVDLNTIIGTDSIFDLEKIREKATLANEKPTVTAKREFAYHKDDTESSDDEHLDETNGLIPMIDDSIEDDLLPLDDKDLLIFDDDLPDFDDFEEDMDEDIDEDEESEGTGRKKRER